MKATIMRTNNDLGSSVQSTDSLGKSIINASLSLLVNEKFKFILLKMR